MKRMVARIAGLAVLVGLTWVPSASASTHAFVQFDAPSPYVRPVAAPPPYAYGYVWQPGYYVRISFGHRRWIPGRWVRAPYARRGWLFRRHGRWDREREYRGSRFEIGGSWRSR